ncbi:hypothetical protein [Terriglobus saanensis]|uniref:hypothetical protein n=1 Tax=Terriglobus saanensis TaxID=870903 RepID=UPI00031CEF47|nr:hypothetical protein [Terriglobus saanensis]
MKIRDFARSTVVLCVAVATLSLVGCYGNRPYKTTENQFAGRPVPPSQLTSRVMVSVANSGSLGTSGSLAILDSIRDIRNNVYNANSSFSISGFATNNATKIINYPEQLGGYVYGSTDASLTSIDYSTEKTLGSALGSATLPGGAADITVPPDGTFVLAALETAGLLEVIDKGTGSTYALPLPNVYRVAMNPSHTVMLAMTRNNVLATPNNSGLYRIVKLNTNQAPPTGYTACQPVNLPVYCALPVTGNFDHPTGVYFSLDGSQAYVLNCGVECGGTASSVSYLTLDALRIDNYAASSPVTATTTVPGGVTAALSDGSTLYVSGQQLQPDGLFAGTLSTISLATKAVTGQYSISDGTHTKMLFGDNSTLWIGSQNCASGERQAHSLNYNCLTMFNLSKSTATVIPAVDPTSASSKVPYPNDDGNQYYYGSLTGLCWVQGYNKMYTAYGGQVHAFSTVDGSEINNFAITVQGIALDVAYLDATTNAAN